MTAIVLRDSETASLYDVILGRNVAAARGRARLSQSAVADRMRALGHAQWQQQVVANVERGGRRRRLLATEVMALAWVLETSITNLMRPTEDDGLVRLPCGAVIDGGSIALLAAGHNDHGVSWDGAEPQIQSGKRCITNLQKDDTPQPMT